MEPIIAAMYVVLWLGKHPYIATARLQPLQVKRTVGDNSGSNIEAPGEETIESYRGTCSPRNTNHHLAKDESKRVINTKSDFPVTAITYGTQTSTGC